MAILPFITPDQSREIQTTHVNHASLFELRCVEQDSGELVVIESERDVAMNFKRAFYVFGTPSGTIRGKHAHRECNQLLICLHGEIQVTLFDGMNTREVTLNSPTQGLFVPPMLWMHQEYCATDSVLLVLADRAYEESDYIRNKTEFLRLTTP